jgi:uncharacterized protein YecE (DUF72 family)
VPLPENILIGTSAFTAEGWVGSFYPAGMQPRDFLSYYATQFNVVELDTTFYRTPSASVVEGWNMKTPPGFIFAAKIPQVITHDKVLVDCDDDLNHFLKTMSALGDKLGPLLFQFGYFNRDVFKSGKEFLARLEPFLEKLPKDFKFAVEIRNKYWIDQKYADLLRKHGVAMALIDQSWVPRPWEMRQTVDLATTDWTYVRWLGDRKTIEAATKTWDKAFISREAELGNWVVILKKMVNTKKILKMFAFANNHYAGHGPATVKLFTQLWDKW